MGQPTMSRENEQLEGSCSLLTCTCNPLEDAAKAPAQQHTTI